VPDDSFEDAAADDIGLLLLLLLLLLLVLFLDDRRHFLLAFRLRSFSIAMSTYAHLQLYYFHLPYLRQCSDID